MNFEEERKNWKHDEASIEVAINTMTGVMEDADATLVAKMSVDTIYRPFLQLIHSAQVRKVNPTEVREASVRLINMMIMETCMRVGSRDENGGKLPFIQCINEFMAECASELQIDIEFMMLNAKELTKQ
jgi:hypothetical protein